MQPALLSREDTLILLCCRIKPDAQQRMTIDDLLAQHLDWEYILTIARRHGIANLLYNNIIDRENKSCVPPSIFDRLEKSYHSAAYSNLLFLKEYKDIAHVFNAEQVALLPLKGIDFIKTVYPNIALRTSNDIDILVKKADLNRAKDILLGLGYVQIKTGHTATETFHWVFSRTVAAASVFVELHWDLDIPQSPFKVSVDDFWSRAEIVTSGGTWFYRLSLEDSILFTAFHILRAPLAGDTRGIISLRGVVDVSEMIKKYGDRINWDAIINRAQQYHVERPVLLVLYLIEEFLHVQVKEDIREELQKRGFQEDMLNRMAREWIFCCKGIDDIFLPSIIDAAKSEAGLVKKLSLSSLFKTAYVVLRHQIRTAPSLLQALKVIRKKFWKSFLNYLRIGYLMVCDYRKLNRMLQDGLVKKKELEEVDNWIRSR
jgi:hypothetical protein